MKVSDMHMKYGLYGGETTKIRRIFFLIYERRANPVYQFGQS